MYKVLIAICIFTAVTVFQYKNLAEGSDKQAPSAHTDSPDEMMGEVPQEEKSELALMMQDIDESYKAVEAMSGYYKYKKKQWKRSFAVDLSELTGQAGTQRTQREKIIINKLEYI